MRTLIEELFGIVEIPIDNENSQCCKDFYVNIFILNNFDLFII